MARSLPRGVLEAKERIGLGWGCQERERVNRTSSILVCAPDGTPECSAREDRESVVAGGIHGLNRKGREKVICGILA